MPIQNPGACHYIAHFTALTSSLGIDDESALALVEQRATPALAHTAQALMRMAAVRLTAAPVGVPWIVSMMRRPP